MEIEEGLVTWLKAQSPVPALGRIYPEGARPKQDPVPALTYLNVSDVPAWSLSGAAGLSRARIQLNCWGGSYDETKALARTLRLLLDGYKGLMGTVSVTSVTRLSMQGPLWDDQAKEYKIIMDFLIGYKES